MSVLRGEGGAVTYFSYSSSTVPSWRGSSLVPRMSPKTSSSRLKRATTPARPEDLAGQDGLCGVVGVVPQKGTGGALAEERCLRYSYILDSDLALNFLRMYY